MPETAMASATFKVGDVVQLKAGGPLMTITEIGLLGLFCYCSWHTATGVLEESMFPTSALQAGKTAS